MKTLLTMLVTVLLAGCIPGRVVYPEMKVTIHHVPKDVMHLVCDKHADPDSVVHGCIIVDMCQRTCTITLDDQDNPLAFVEAQKQKCRQYWKTPSYYDTVNLARRMCPRPDAKLFLQ